MPHPDHFVVDIRSGAVRFVGPETKEEKAEWDASLNEKAVLEESVAALMEANETKADPADIEDNLKFIAIGEEKLEIIRKLITGS